jgi:hypothetical protein
MHMIERYAAFFLIALSSISLSAQTEQEPNDNTAQANVLLSGSAVSGDIGCGNNSSDYFAITTSGDGRLDLSVGASNTGALGSLQQHGAFRSNIGARERVLCCRALLRTDLCEHE